MMGEIQMPSRPSPSFLHSSVFLLQAVQTEMLLMRNESEIKLEI